MILDGWELRDACLTLRWTEAIPFRDWQSGIEDIRREPRSLTLSNSDTRRVAELLRGSGLEEQERRLRGLLSDERARRIAELEAEIARLKGEK